ncbi:MAG TPA: hypothetical protein VHG89_10300 [Verrucomicrobiae bacterium]|nr:hypothetical protein [Verrucomicrobiae bacterium]
MRISIFIVAAVGLALCGCKWLSDDGVHLAFCLKAGAQTLRHSANTELTVAFEPLDGTNQIYTVQFCKDSVVVVWSKHGGSSTYQLNYVALPQDFYLHKTNEATFITLRKNGDRIDVVNAQ